MESSRKPFMIGVAGGTASGKSTVCDLLMEKLGQHDVNIVEKQVVHLSQDSFYRELTEAESEKAKKGMFNFDHPQHFQKNHVFLVTNWCHNFIQSALVSVELPCAVRDIFC